MASDQPHAPTADHAWMQALRGRFLVFEGPDGSGKTTQFRRFLALCREQGLPVCDVREPGGTAIGERIRDILLDNSHGEMSVRCEMLLYMASRAQLLAERIRPALSRGDLVLADRFVQSTIAYQGAAGGLSRDDIRAVAQVVCNEVAPDLVLIFDVDDQIAAGRMGAQRDRMESRDVEYRRRVREGYREQAGIDPAGNVIIDASADEKAVFARTLAEIRSRLATT